MKRKIIIFLIGCVVLSLLLFCVYIIHRNVEQKSFIENNRKKMPPFSFLSYDKKNVTKNDLMSGQPTMIIYFHPECEHCINELQSINNEIDSIHANIICISVATNEIIDNCNEVQKLKNNRNVFLLNDKDNRCFEYFGIKTFSSTIIYDKNNSLIKTFSGEVSFSTIKQLL